MIIKIKYRILIDVIYTQHYFFFSHSVIELNGTERKHSLSHRHSSSSPFSSSSIHPSNECWRKKWGKGMREGNNKSIVFFSLFSRFHILSLFIYPCVCCVSHWSKNSCRKGQTNMVLTQVQQSVPFSPENVNVERTTVTTKAPDKVLVNTNSKKKQ